MGNHRQVGNDCTVYPFSGVEISTVTLQKKKKLKIKKKKKKRKCFDRCLDGIATISRTVLSEEWRQHQAVTEFLIDRENLYTDLAIFSFLFNICWKRRRLEQSWELQVGSKRNLQLVIQAPTMVTSICLLSIEVIVSKAHMLALAESILRCCSVWVLADIISQSEMQWKANRIALGWLQSV